VQTRRGEIDRTGRWNGWRDYTIGEGATVNQKVERGSDHSVWNSEPLSKGCKDGARVQLDRYCTSLCEQARRLQNQEEVVDEDCQETVRQLNHEYQTSCQKHREQPLNYQN
jgi:hypothetical protein